MVCTANDILVWKDFPKGLRVLLLDEDSDSASELRSKLEKIDYIVSTFLDENEALLAVSNRFDNFHIAIVEVNTRNSDGIFKFLEAAKGLPTIMTSRMHCLNTIMKSIALGAVEFLQKPISDDKLRNIWQHVVHKAFNAKGSVISDSLKPVKESVISILQFSSEKKGETNNHIPKEVEIESRVHENGHDQAAGSEKYSAPSTPQLNQVPSNRLLFDGDSHCQDQANSSSEAECGEQVGKCKSVETTSRDDSVAEVTTMENVVKEESDSGDASKSENDIPLCQQNKDDASNIYCESENSSKASGLQKLRGCKSNRKKMKIGWTPELHKQFVHAVEQLGLDHAIPSRILELMKVEGLTRHNVASHLQKYRMHQRHILPKQNGRWVQPRDLIPTVCYPHNPVIAYPPYHPLSPHAFPAGLFFPVWGQPSSQLPGLHVWGSPSYSAPNWHWNPYSLNPSGFYNGGCGGVDNGCAMPQCSAFHPAADALDKAVSEAISKPWLPLPLGLNPPSTDTVLTELSKQGISAVSSRIMDGSDHC